MNSPCLHTYKQPVNHRIARAATGATVALSTLWAGFTIFGPVSDERARHLAAGPPTVVASAELRRGHNDGVRLVTTEPRRDTPARGCRILCLEGS